MTIFRSDKLAIAAAFALVLGFSVGGISPASAQGLQTSPQAATPAPVVAATAKTPEISTERLELAKKYVATVPIEADIKAALEETIVRIPAEQRVLFRSIAEKTIDYGRLRNAAELAAAAQFTAEELKAMTAFYATPEGASIRNKMNKYQQEMAPVVNSVLEGFAKKLQENNIQVNPQQ